MGKEEITLRNYYYWKNEIDAFLNEKEDKSNKTSSWNNETNDNRYPTEKLVKTTLDTKENTSNKTSSWNSTTNNTRYPTEKLVKTSLDTKINTSALVNDLTTGGNSKVLSAEQGKVLKEEIDGKSDLGHTHDDRYYTESEIDNKLASKENNNNKTLIWTNTPDNTRYPTEKLVKDSLDGKSDISHTHPNATSSSNGLMSSDDKAKLDGISSGANAYTHPSYTARTGKPTGNQTPAFGGTATVSQIISDASGHVTGATDRTIKIPNTLANGTTAGLSTNDYTTTEKTKLAGVATGATKNTVSNSLSDTSTTNALSAAKGADLQEQINNIITGETATDHNHDNLYSVSLTKLNTPTSGYIATYEVTQGNTSLGKIDIPKDYLVKSGSVKSVTTANNPVSGYAVGDKYIDFIINTKDSSGTDEHIYINVKDLIDTYNAGAGLTLSDNTFRVNFGSSTTTTANYAVGCNDTRLSNTRTPTDNTVTTAKIVDRNVTTAKLADSSVTSAKIADGTIVNGDIANTTIQGGKLVNGTITATQLASNAVETAKIKDANVTTAKIADANVTTAKLADSSVTSAKIADGTIVNGDIANTTIQGGKLVNGTITATQLASNAVKTAKIKDANVTVDKFNVQYYGGRNLLPDTQQFGSLGTNTSNASTQTSDYYNNTRIRQVNASSLTSGYYDIGWTTAPAIGTYIHGDYYTFSFWAKGNGKIICYFYGPTNHIKAKPIRCTSGGNKSTAYNDGSCEFTLTNDWKRYYVTWHLNPASDSTNLATVAKYVWLRTMNGVNAYYAGPMLEKGEIPHEWSPNPEEKANASHSHSYISTAAGSVGESNLASNAVTTAKIKDANVTTAKIADSAITSAKIADGTIANGDIANTTIQGGKLVNGTITATQLASNAVETAKIKDANVTTAKIANSNITTAKIADSAVTTAKIANASITNAKLSSENIPNGTNLNNIRTPGFYHQAGNANTSTMTNLPFSIRMAFTLLVESLDSGFTKQTLTYWHNGDTGNYNNGWNHPRTFIRVSHYDSTQWGDWYEVSYNHEFHRYSAGNGTVGYYKLLRFTISGGYSDNSINFSINHRNQPKTNISINFSYYKKDNNSSNFYYKIDKFYYDGYPIGAYLVQTGDAIGRGTFEFYVYRPGWNDMSVSEIDTNWRVRDNLVVDRLAELVTSLPTGYVTATINPYYKDTTYSVATTSANGLMSSGDKSKLDGIATGANKTTIANNLTTSTAGSALDATQGKWLKDNCVQTAGTNLSKSGVTLNHATSGVGAKSSGLYKTTIDAQGHITAATAVTKADITGLGIPGSDTNTTYSAGTGLSLSGTTFSLGTTIIANGTNLNTITTQGFYAQPTTSNTTNMTNIPVKKAFTMIVEAFSDGGVAQQITFWGASGDIQKFVRTGNSSSWSNWVEITKDTNTTYSAGDGIKLDGTTFKHNSGTGTAQTTQSVYSIKFDKFGHINAATAVSSMTPTSHTHGNITNAGAIGSTANLPIITTTSGKLTTGAFESTATNIKMNGTQSVGSSNNFARADHVHPIDTSRAASSHTHGNITNAGAIGSTANKPIITTTSGKLTTGSFGTTANTFCQGNDSRLSDARTPLAHTHKGWDSKSSSNNWQLYVNSDLGLAFFRYDAGVPGNLSNNATFDILTSGATVTNSPLHGTSFTTQNPYLSAWITAEGYVQVWTSDKSKFSKLIFSGFYLTTA